ncbi:MAG: hypothetical protein JO316_06680 [Abitibacteriaceae bacterium]|nr:hypothetical protein [Abditibacteriaceae bacterium]
MAVTVKITDKDKRQAASGPPPDLSDYVVQGEKGEGTKAFVIWFLLIIVASVGLSLNPNTMGFGIGIFVWWLVSCIIYFFIAPRMVLRRLRMHGSEYEVTSRNHPRLRNLLSKASGMLGLDTPEAFVVDETIPQIRILGSNKSPFLIITKGAMDLLQNSELDTLVLRCLVQARQGHVRRLSLLQFVNDTAAPLRILVWPAMFYAWLLRGTNWQEFAAETADRLTLLLMKNYKVLLSALLKLHAATDPLMQETKISSQDVDNYIKQSGFIGLEGQEISTQYRLGSAIHENPYLEERIKALNSFADSDEFDSALTKLAAARIGKAATIDTTTDDATPAAAKPTATSQPATVKK